MSYARWSGDSGVYVYLDVGGYLRCCGCSLGDEWHASTQAMLAHLQRHREAGDAVPDGCLSGLLADQVANDEFIAGRRRVSA